jgi:hypothetical protein
MPKPLKKKPRLDENQLAHALVKRLTASETTLGAPVDFETQYKAHMAKLGAKGGRIGGKRRLETLTQERRSEIALKAADARWAEERRKKR